MSQPDPYARRVALLRGALAERGLDGAVVAWAPHVRYLSGIVAECAPAFLLIDQERVTAVAPASAGIAEAPGIEVVPYIDSSINEIIPPRRTALAEVSRLVEEHGIQPDRLGVERGQLVLSDMDAFPDLRQAPDIGHAIARLRMRKDPDEIACIRANLRVLEAGFDAARETIRPGVTEIAVWSALHGAMMAKAGAPFPLEGNFASGPRTLADEPQATSRRLEAGDAVFIDLYPIIDGYCADLTRTFVVGEPAAAQRARHAVLEKALAAGVAALGPGVRACGVDRAVRSSVAAAIGGYAFPHHAGHALGLQGQERPMLIPGDDTVIEPGMVIAIEPGAYLPDTGGMRVEGNYLVTETGCISISDYPIEIFACG
ncbi:MAG: M24 family metallopeptidase [Thermomicrobiales bacterium]